MLLIYLTQQVSVFIVRKQEQSCKFSNMLISLVMQNHVHEQIDGRSTLLYVILIFANFKSCVLSNDPSSDHVMPHAEVSTRAQASHGNITV